MDGDSSQPSAASSRRSRRDTALCLTTSQPSTSSARKNSLRRAWENTRVRRTIVTADLECGDFAGNERGATNVTHSQYSPAILDALFDRPIFQTPDFVTRSGIPKPTAAIVVRKLREADILLVIREASGSRPAILAFRELVNQAEGKRVL